MRYWMSVIYGHPVIAATRATRFSDHVTKRNGGFGDENGLGLGLVDCLIFFFFSSMRIGQQKLEEALTGYVV